MSKIEKGKKYRMIKREKQATAISTFILWSFLIATLLTTLLPYKYINSLVSNTCIHSFSDAVSLGYNNLKHLMALDSRGRWETVGSAAPLAIPDGHDRDKECTGGTSKPPRNRPHCRL